MKPEFVFASIAFAFQFTWVCADPAYVDISSLHVFKGTVTLSGFNSGGGLAQQLLVSHPSLFRGIGVIQQVFYRCGAGDGSMDDFDLVCTKLGNTSVELMYPTAQAIDDIRNYSASGLIENAEKLKGKRLYVYAGLSNVILSIESMLSTVKVLETFIQNPYRIRTRVQDAGFLFPTDNPAGSECSYPDGDETKFYIGNCNLNVPYELLNFLLGDAIQRPIGQIAREKIDFGLVAIYQERQLRMRPLQKFNQSLYFGALKTEDHFMSSDGYIYVPSRCGRTPWSQCHLHIYFHGCLTGSEFTGENHIRQSGYLELAEMNGVIMIFPQVTSSEKIGNGIGCWDSFGYTGPLYATLKGGQVSIVRRMLAAMKL